VWAAALTEEIRAIPDPVLRHAVAGILDCTASGFGEVAIREAGAKHMALVGFALEAEVLAGLKAGIATLGDTDPDLAVSEAEAWIRQKLTHTDAVQVAWAFGPLRFVEFLGRPRKRIIVDSVVYDCQRKRIVGVLTDGGGLYRV